MKLAEANESQRNSILLALHPHWRKTMRVSVWGRGKATRFDKEACRGQAGDAKYPGDCDACAFFMGARFEKREYRWGDFVEACCGLDLETVVDPERMATGRMR